jgi:hypothetical protein
VGERQRRRRARGALVAVALLVAVAPSSATLHPPLTKIGGAPALAGANDQQLAATITARASRRSSTPSTVVQDTPIQPPPATFDGPAAAPAPPPEALRAAGTATATMPPATGGGVWAVIIGIDDYPGRGADLRASVADANDVDAALAGYGVPADHRLVVRNTQATAGIVLDAARWLVDRAGPDATAVFFYAGHVRRLGDGREAIIGADGNLATDLELADVLRPLEARQTWLALASCYAGGFDELLAPGRILTGAAPANGVAYESSELGNSYLVEYMVDRAMREGQAPASVEQSFAWAVAALRAEHPQRVPVQYDQLDGELRLGTPRTTAPRPSPSPPPPSTPPPTTSPPPEEPPEDDGPCLLTIGSVAGCDDQATSD